jgi:hypothetical protein
MIATHATKVGVRYRYYASRPNLHGEAGTAKLGYGTVCRRCSAGGADYGMQQLRPLKRVGWSLCPRLRNNRLKLDR